MVAFAAVSGRRAGRAGLCALAAGPTVLAQMSAYTVDDPNPVGTLVMAAVGLTMLLFGLAFAAAMVPLCLKTGLCAVFVGGPLCLGRLEAWTPSTSARL